VVVDQILINISDKQWIEFERKNVYTY